MGKNKEWLGKDKEFCSLFFFVEFDTTSNWWGKIWFLRLLLERVFATWQSSLNSTVNCLCTYHMISCAYAKTLITAEYYINI